MIGLGSDFDTMGQFLVGLNDASTQQTLINELLTYYSEQEVSDWDMKFFSISSVHVV